MLNKPTKVYPYNDFIDVADGLDFKFSLNRGISDGYIAVYNSNNDQLVETIDLPSWKAEDAPSETNDNTIRDFIIPSLNPITKYSYGSNYYWKCHYWINWYSRSATISQATRIFRNKDILDWDKNARRITIPNEPTAIIGSTYLSLDNEGSSHVILIRGDAPSFNTIYADINNGIEYWCCTRNLDRNILGEAIKINRMFPEGVHNQYVWYNMKPSLYYGSSIFTDEYNLYFYKNDGSSGLCVPGDCIAIGDDGTGAIPGDLPVLKVESIEFTTFNDQVALNIYFTEPIPINLGSEPDSNGRYSYATCYRNFDYNVSPPNYFSIRKKPNITFTNISPATPFVDIKATTPYGNAFEFTPLDLNSYHYEIYLLNTNNSYKLLQKSPIFSTLSISWVSGDSTNQVYNFEQFSPKGLKWNSMYKVKLIGQTWEGMDFEAETTFQTSNFEPTQVTEFIEFDKDKGCIKINSSKFTVPDSSYELQLYRYNHETEMLDYVSTVKYDVNTSSVTGGILKYSYVYDFNIISGVEYTYYAFIINSTGSITSSFKSNSVIPRWYGTYLTDLTYVDKDVYTPDLDNIWFVDLNYEPGEVSRNYQVNHPIGINQQYPKSIRGKANYKTGSLSGLLGKISCTNGKYEETLLLNDKWDEFCGNGNLKLIRGHTRSENMIADIDSMNTSVYNYKATLLNIGYTQIDDLTLKQINKEV